MFRIFPQFKIRIFDIFWLFLSIFLGHSSYFHHFSWFTLDRNGTEVTLSLQPSSMSPEYPEEKVP